ncbi:AAA family ATPase [Brachybacterium hainanense]|uniref:AAA family ATPase n=1 Tax=Brachybacterium hainanense TaxID=1541174 RepID=A0ABV6RB31_9MICO
MNTPADAPARADRTSRADQVLPVLWLCGAPASGKSTTAWNLFASRPEEQIAYLDIDQLAMLLPDPGDSFALAVGNLAAITRLHRALGTRALIVSGVIDPEQMVEIDDALGDDAVVTWCLMDADGRTLRRRITERGWPEELIDRALAEARDLRRTSIAHRITTTWATLPQRARTEGAAASSSRALRPPGRAPSPADSRKPSNDPLC